MSRPELKVLRARARRAIPALSAPSFAHIIRYVEALRDEDMERLASASSDTRMRQLQGSVQSLNQILGLVLTDRVETDDEVIQRPIV